MVSRSILYTPEVAPLVRQLLQKQKAQSANFSFTFTRAFPLFLFVFLLISHVGWSQCSNPSPFGMITAPTGSGPVTITTCAFAGEYSTINSCVSGNTYLFTATGGAGNFITIRQGTPGGLVLGFGFSPISVTCTSSGPLYLHYNTNAVCGTDGTCHTGIMGQVLLRDDIKATKGITTHQVDISKIPEGGYIIQLRSDADRYTKGLMIMRKA